MPRSSTVRADGDEDLANEVQQVIDNNAEDQGGGPPSSDGSPDSNPSRDDEEVRGGSMDEYSQEELPRVPLRQLHLKYYLPTQGP